MQTPRLKILSVSIPVPDGQILAGTLIEPARPNGVSVQINAATGVARRYYESFAAFLAGRGFTVLAFDYRGIGGSPQSPGAPLPRMLDWGRRDIPAAADFLSRHAPGHRRAMVCHSFGGQMLGLMPQAGEIDAVLAIASQHGYWRNWSRRHQIRLLLSWYVAFPAVVGLIDRIPGWWLGGQPLPGAIARDWRRWCCSPHYLVDDDGAPLRPHNHAVRARMRMISFADDHDFGPKKGVDRLMGYYPNASIERLHVAPRDWGLQRIGHFGFFKRDMPQQCWAAQADWLLQAASAPATATASAGAGGAQNLKAG
ncbi:alpha/beta fold hydrolase [Ferrovibrio sp.]|jgi:predicted alpha/beta hydrolase|uniref:alpha/beta hydrolase family protein n=1 Tax=Ferrovibrio sp. TaxID=1917215 RepID=UPI0035AEC2C2